MTQLRARGFLCVDVRAYIYSLVSKNMRARFRRPVVLRITLPRPYCRKFELFSIDDKNGPLFARSRARCAEEFLNSHGRPTLGFWLKHFQEKDDEDVIEDDSSFELITCQSMMSCPAQGLQLVIGQGLRTSQRTADGVALRVGSPARVPDAPTNVAEINEERCSVSAVAAMFGGGVSRRRPGGNTGAVDPSCVCPPDWWRGKRE